MLREGSLTIVEGKNKEKRYLFVFNDIILITKPNPKTNNKTYTYIKTISMNEDGASVEPVPDTTCM